MVPGVHHFVIYQGTDDPILAAQWKDGGVPVSLADVELRAQLRRHPDDDEVLIDFSVEAGNLVLTDAEHGRFALVPGAVVTSALQVEYGYYDIAVHRDGKRHRLLMGQWTLSRQSTRA